MRVEAGVDWKAERERRFCSRAGGVRRREINGKRRERAGRWSGMVGGGMERKWEGGVLYER